MATHQILDRFFEKKRKKWQQMARDVYADVCKEYSKKTPAKKELSNTHRSSRSRETAESGNEF